MRDSKQNDTISRRGFISGVPSVTAALTVAGPAVAQAQPPAALTAGDLHAYLKSLDGGWVNWEKTVDTFKAGSPEAVVKGIAVAWMSYTHALRRSLELGCNLFITHEPTYFNHHDKQAGFYREERSGHYPLPRCLGSIPEDRDTHGVGHVAGVRRAD